MVRLSNNRRRILSERIAKTDFNDDYYNKIITMSKQANRIGRKYRNTLNTDIEQYQTFAKEVAKNAKGAKQFSQSESVIKRMNKIQLMELEQSLSRVISDNVDIRDIRKLKQRKAKELGLTQAELRKSKVYNAGSVLKATKSALWRLENLANESGYSSEDIKEIATLIETKSRKEVKSILKQLSGGDKDVFNELAEYFDYTAVIDR